MVFDIKEALKRAGCCCDDNPDDYTYKPKYSINYSNVIFDIEGLRNRWLDSLSYNYKYRFDFIKKLTTDEIVRLRNSSIDVVKTHQSEINKFLKNNKDVKVEDKLVDVYDDYPAEKKQCDAGWGDKNNKCKDLPKVKSESTVLEDIAKKYFTEDFIEDFNNNNCSIFTKYPMTGFSITSDSFNKERKEIDRKNADSILQAEDESIINILNNIDSPIEKEKQLLDAVDFIKGSVKDGYQRDGYQMPTCFYNPATKDIYTATEPKNPLDLLIDFSTADNKARKNFLNLLVNSEAAPKVFKKEEEKEMITIEVKNDEGTFVEILSRPVKEEDSLHIFAVSYTGDVYEAKKPQKDSDINLDCFKLIFGKDAFRFVKNNWAYFKKDYLKIMDKRDYSEINARDNKVLKDGENLTVELALERSGFNKDCTIKKEDVKLNGVMFCGDGITKKTAPLKFDTGPFDTSAALKRAGVNQSKEEIENIKRKINYNLDILKPNDINENSFIENSTLNINPGKSLKPGRILDDIKEAGKERINKLDKEFNDACDVFNKTIKPLPSFNIKSKRGIYSVSQNNDNISEVEIMAASKLPKVEKETVTPVSIIEKSISNKSIEQITKETTVRLKKFTLTVKSAFQELIRKD